MNQTESDSLEAILRNCASSTPQPWYPKLHAESTGVARDSLDLPLEKLRLGGLIRLTPWEHGKGQGYELTPEGTALLQNPRDLGRLKDGKWSPRPAPTRKPLDDDGLRSPLSRKSEMVQQTFQIEPNPLVSRLLFWANILMFVFGMFLAHRNGVDLNIYLKGNSNLLGGRAGNNGQNVAYDEILDKSGALNYQGILRGQWWRLISCCFVHIGLIHLGMNMFFLYRAGPLIEHLWGHARFLAIYLLSGLGGSCLALLVSQGGCAGASGALCGIFAALALWLVLYRQHLPPELLSRWFANIAINIFLLVFVSLMPGISWAGHLGGAMAGLVAAYMFHVHRFGHPLLRWPALLGAVFLPALMVGLLIFQFHFLRQREEAVPKAWKEGEEALRLFNQEVLPILRTPVPDVFARDDLEEVDLRNWEYLTQSAGGFDATSTRFNDAVEVYEKADNWFFLWPKGNRSRAPFVDDAYLFALTNLYLSSEADARGTLLHSEAGMWLNRPVSRRWPLEAVQKTVSALAQERTRLMQYADQFDKITGPLNRRNEQLRLICQSLVKEWAGLFANIESYLDQEDPINPRPEAHDAPAKVDTEVSGQALNKQIKRINGMRMEIVKLSTEKSGL